MVIVIKFRIDILGLAVGVAGKYLKPVLFEYQPEWRIIGSIPFPKVLALCEMQTALSRLGTWVTMSIPYNDTH